MRVYLRLLSIVAAVLVGLGLVTFDPNAPAAVASSSANALATTNSWIVKEFATEAVIEGVDYAANTLNDSYVKNTPVTSTPTTVLAPDVGKNKGFKLRGKGILGALLMLGGSVGLDLLLSGDAGAVDPATVLPTGAGQLFPPGWTAQPGWPPPDFANVAAVVPAGDPVVVVSGSSRTLTAVFTAAAGSTSSSNRVRYECRSGQASATDPTGFLWTMHEAAGQWPNNGPWTNTFTGVCTNSQDIRLNFPSPTPYANGGYTYALWYPGGSPWRPPDAVGVEDMPRTLKNEVVCRRAGQPDVIETVESAPFTLAQLRAGTVIPTLPAVSCPDNMWAAQADPSIGTAGQPDTPLSDAPITTDPEVAAEAETIIDGNPVGPRLEHKPSPDSPDEQYRDCWDVPQECQGWIKDVIKDRTYRCVDSKTGLPLLLAACEPYYGPPRFVPEPETDPDPEAEYDCFPNGMGAMNPANWVVFPLKCLFIPKTAPDLSGVSTAWSTTAVGQVGGFLGGLGAGTFMPSDTSCGEIVNVELPVLVDNALVVSTCDPFWQNASVIRSVIGVSFLLGAAFIGVRMLLRTIRVEVPVDH